MRPALHEGADQSISVARTKHEQLIGIDIALLARKVDGEYGVGDLPFDVVSPLLVVGTIRCAAAIVDSVDGETHCVEIGDFGIDARRDIVAAVLSRMEEDDRGVPRRSGASRLENANRYHQSVARTPPDLRRGQTDA